MAAIKQQTARSDKQQPDEVAEELLAQLNGDSPKLVVCFASRDRDQRALNDALRRRLPPDVRFLGSTTSGEIDHDGMHFGTVVLTALSGDFDVGIGLGRGLSIDAMKAGAHAVEQAAEQLGTPVKNLSTNRHVGFVIDDGFRYKKEELLLGALDKNQGLVLVGGGAADSESDPMKQSSRIHVDGEVDDDCVAVALFQTDAPWAALRHHAYRPIGETIQLTKVDDDGTRVLEIDGQPAAKRYAELLGVGVDELEFGLPKGFSHRPIALKVGREYFMRSPWKALPDGSILFANLLEEDSEYELMEMGDMPVMMEGFFRDEVPTRVRNPSGLLCVHCSGRLWVAEASGTTPQISEGFKTAPSIAGMNGHFEIYCGFNINSTLTALAFGAD
ncbi:MAG: FIST N-terminal domain-containing protein [Myxococcota bacterium]